MSHEKRSLVVIPTYNERDNVDDVLAATWAAVPDLHVLFVDDGSPDGTGQMIKERMRREGGRLHLIERAGKLGLGTAYIAGFHWALAQDYAKIIEMDADLSHDPAVLKEILKGLDAVDVVIGSRYIAGGGTSNWNRIRKLISMTGSSYARLILGMKVRDLTGGFNGWRREVLERIGLEKVESNGYSFQIELKYRAQQAGFRLSEVPIMFTERRAGQSKMSGGIVFEAIVQVWRLRFGKRPRAK